MNSLCKISVGAVLVTALWRPLAAQETGSERMLVIRLKDGKTVNYPLSQVDSIQFVDGNVSGQTRLEPGRRDDAGSGQSRTDQPIAGMRVLRSAGSLSGSTGGQNVFDGSPRTGWSSLPNARFPHEFVVELPTSTAIGAVEFDNGQASYPGASTREVRVLGSNVSASGPFQVLTTTSLAQGGNAQRFAVAPATVRWLRVLIFSNHGHPNYTELMDMRIYPPAER